MLQKTTQQAEKKVELFSSLPEKTSFTRRVLVAIPADTDHQFLCRILQKREYNGRSARWLDFSAECDFQIEYRSENYNALADLLPCIDSNCTVQAGY